MEHITVKEIAEAAGGRLLAGNPAAMVTGISIDSREAKEGCLFVPLIGEKNDAHRFIMTAPVSYTHLPEKRERLPGQIKEQERAPERPIQRSEEAADAKIRSQRKTALF